MKGGEAWWDYNGARMALTSGNQLGPYEIQSPLGAGGMGEVYRARDTRLDRTVAIKILPSHLSSDPDARQRFEREARAISSLSHPNICHLYDVGSQDGVEFIVMEFLEGETLQHRLLRGALPPKQAVDYGIEIAEALDRAHQVGIVHRDVKPGNIMLTKLAAKLLDFGLAKPVAAAIVTRPSSTGSSASSTPTMSIASMTAQADPLTQRGTVVGTFQYIAPEVLQGKEADPRSDVFALGAVLYEMITGKRAFAGKSQLSVMTAILESEPDQMALVPASLGHVVRTCLAKDPADRWQSAREVARELRWAVQSRGSNTANATEAKPLGWRPWVLWAATTLAIAGLTLAATYYATRPASGVPLMVSVIPPVGVFPDTSGRNGPPQISPDGTKVAFVGCKTESASSSIIGSSSCSIWLRSLRLTEAHEVAGTSGGYFPFWSADGHDIGFFADGKLKRVPTDGGPLQVICDADDARGGSWNNSGTIIFAATRGSPIFRVPAEGGAPVAITRSTPASNLAQVGSHRWPTFLPDGEHFLYLDSPNGACNDLNEIHFASLSGKQDASLTHACTGAAFAAGHLIFWRDGNVVAQPFDPQRGVLGGAAVAVVEHVALDNLFSLGEFSASAEGKLLYVEGEGTTDAQLVWYDRTGKVLGTLGESDQYVSVSISRDGSRVVADAIHLSGTSIRILDARGSRTLLTLGSADMGYPVWSPDGRQVYFTSKKNGLSYDISMKAADGSGEEHKVVTFDRGQFGAALLAASPDGKFLAYVTSDPATKQDIYVIPLAGDRRPQPFLHSPANESAPAFSPDSKWLAYESNHSGRNEIYITPFPEGGAQYQVSTSGGERPVWRRDGKEIFYREGLRLMSVEVTTNKDHIDLGTPRTLFEVAVRALNGRWYDVSPDGRLLTNTSRENTQAKNFGLVVNWPAKLSK